ncbi:ABC transporter permease [Candidatus Woesearchaeota archaeon]|nr:ABC transporter permease [Candidatus Woesearchaeota archaeon]
MITELLKYSVSNLWKRKLRSFLSILSILIGITAIFVLVSFGQGIEKFVNDFAQKQGIDKLMMMPGGFGPPGTSNIKFTEEDINFIRKINGVDEITGWMGKNGKVKFKDYKEKYTLILGLSTDREEARLVEEIATIEIEKGRNLKDGDVLKAVLGHNYLIPNKLFKKAISVGDKIEINDMPVEVVGFYGEVGNPQDDSQAYLSYDGFKEIFKEDTFEYVAIRAAPDQNPAQLADKIKERFREHRNQKKGEEDFTIQTFEQAIETFTSVILIINGVLVLIALISIVVAAVNIANTMYTSILERTQEIGIMKSIGARNRFILFVFIIEAGLLGIIGGIFGVLFGYIIAKFGGFTAAYFDLSMLRPYFPWWLIIGCLAFAFFTGAGSGLLPARQASKLNPVDALRYE